MVENAPPSAGEVRALAHQLLSWADQLATARQISLAEADRHEFVLALATSARAIARLRARIFPDLGFANPGWLVLLEVFIREADGIRISLEHLATEVELPLLTTYQCVNQLIDNGLIERSGGASGSQEVRLTLTLSGWQKMTELLMASAEHARPRLASGDASLLPDND